jgi:hypothetical protein
MRLVASLSLLFVLVPNNRAQSASEPAKKLTPAQEALLKKAAEHGQDFLRLSKMGQHEEAIAALRLALSGP